MAEMNVTKDEVTEALTQWLKNHDEPCRCSFCKQGRSYWISVAHESYERVSSDTPAKLFWYVVYQYQIKKYLEENGIRQQG